MLNESNGTGFFPLAVMPAVPYEGGIRFLLPDKTCDLGEAHSPLVWAILSHCHGRVESRRVAKWASRARKRYSFDEALAVIRDLQRLGVLVDSRRLFSHFHESTKNPPIYPRLLTNTEVAAHARSPRSPVQQGTVVHKDSNQSGILLELAIRRRSTRSFSDEPVTLNDVFYILSCSYGVSTHVVPSAGGLYPLKIYGISTRDSSDFPEGLYEYEPEKNSLIRYQNIIDKEQLRYCFNSESILHNAPLIVVIAADLDRSNAKYGNRGYRFSILEAGHTAQNIHLAAIERNLTTLEYGGFNDDALLNELKVDTHKSMALLTVVGVGHFGPRREKRTGYAEELNSLKRDMAGSSNLFQGAVSQPLGKNSHHSYVAHASYRSSFSRGSFTVRRTDNASGIGSTAAEAELKALVEAFERSTLSNVRTEARARPSDLREPWVDPRRVVPYTVDQYNILDLKPFNESDEYEWVQGTRVKTGDKVWVPVDLVFNDPRKRTSSKCYSAHSSGVAAFTRRDEAVKRALLELLERDAIMTTWLTRKPPSRITDFSLVPHHWQRRCSYWADEEHQVHLLDYSHSGVAISSVVFVSEVYPCVVVGAAASMESYSAALAKAFQEAEGQLTYALGGSKDSKPIRPEHVRTPRDHGRMYLHPEYFTSVEWLWNGTPTAAHQPSATLQDLVEVYDPVVVDLYGAATTLSTVRVISEHAVPINFGFRSEHILHWKIRDRVDPGAQDTPHYFA